MRTFPELSRARFGSLNYDLLARAYALNHSANIFPRLGNRGVVSNPLLDPVTCHNMILEEQHRLGLDHSYGGWFEDRRTLWKDSYLEKTQSWVHLGVDITVPVGTKIAATWSAIVEHVDDDTPEVGGWGPRILVRLISHPNIILLFAHLGQINYEKGDTLSPDTVFAHVGQPPNNGVWFPHVHVQAIDLDHYKRDWYALVHLLDGYATPFEASGAARVFPDPMRFIRLWD